MTEDYFKEHPDTLGTGHHREKITFCRAPGGARAREGGIERRDEEERGEGRRNKGEIIGGSIVYK